MIKAAVLAPLATFVPVLAELRLPVLIHATAHLVVVWLVVSNRGISRIAIHRCY